MTKYKTPICKDHQNWGRPKQGIAVIFFMTFDKDMLRTFSVGLEWTLEFAWKKMTAFTTTLPVTLKTFVKMYFTPVTRLLRSGAKKKMTLPKIEH